MLSVLSSASSAATDEDNPRLRRELAGTTGGLAAATALGLIPVPFGGNLIEISALALDLTTKSLAPEFEIPSDFSITPNVPSSSSPESVLCAYEFPQTVLSGDNQDGDDGVSNGIRDSSSGFLFYRVTPLEKHVWGGLNNGSPNLPRVYHPNADVNVTVRNPHLDVEPDTKLRFPSGVHELKWTAETMMNIPIDVALQSALTFASIGSEFREVRKARLVDISDAFDHVTRAKAFRNLIRDLFEVAQNRISDTGGATFNPNDPQAWYDATSVVTATNANTQRLTVYDDNTPYVIDSGDLPVSASSRNRSIALQSSVMEATDFGGVRFRRVKRALRRQFEPIDDCGQLFQVTPSIADAVILPIGPAPTLIEWKIEELGGPYDPATIQSEMASNQELIDGKIVTTFQQFVTVEDTQAPLLIVPPGFARYAEASVVLADEETDYLGRPGVVDLADANPHVWNNAPAVLNVDQRHAITWQASDVTGNMTDERVQVVTLKSPGTNTQPIAHPAAASTLPFVNPETGSADISRKVDIQLTASDDDIIGGIPDPLAFRIADYPGGGEFEAPLLPYFIHDYRVTPNGETVDNEGTYARTSPLKELAEGFYLADKTGHAKLLADKICNAPPGSYGATEFDNVIPVNFAYQPSAIFVDDEGFTYLQDLFWVCGESVRTNSPPWSRGYPDLAPIARISKWAEDGSLVAMRALTDVNNPDYFGVLQNFAVSPTWDGKIDRSGRLWIRYEHLDLTPPGPDPFPARVIEYSSIDSDLRRDVHHGRADQFRGRPNFRGFAVDDEQGLLYVIRLDGLLVQKRTGAGRFDRFYRLGDPRTASIDLSSVESLGDLEGWGSDTLTDSEGYLYVMDAARERIHKISPTSLDEAGEWILGEYMGWMGSCIGNKANDEGVPYNACDVDMGVSLGFACTDQKCERAADTAGSGPGQFSGLRQMEIDPNDIIYVAERGNSRVQRFGTDGTLAGIAKSTGTGINQGEEPGFMLGNFGLPDFISVNSNSLYILTRDDENGDHFAHSFKSLPFFDQTDDAPCPGNLNRPAGARCSGAKVRYVAKFDFDGKDNFSFVVDDGIDRSSPATVTVTARHVNRHPERLLAECYADKDLVARKRCELDEDTELFIRLVASDKDGFASVDGRDKLAFRVNRPTVNGELKFVSKKDNAALYRYRPNENFHGDDAFAFEVRDDNGAYAGSFDDDEEFVRDSLQVDLTIEPVGDPVVIELDRTPRVARGFRTVISGRFSDVDRDFQPQLQSIDFGDRRQNVRHSTSTPDWENSGLFDLNGRDQKPQTDMMPGSGVLAASHIYTESGNYRVEVDMHNDELGAEPFRNVATMDVEVIDATVLQANISSSLSVDPDVAFPLDITVTNLRPDAGWDGATATAAELKIRVPVGLEVLRVDRTCRNKKTITCPLGDLAPGQEATVRLRARIAYADALEETAYSIEMETTDGGPKVMERSISSSGLSIADADEDGAFDVDDAFPDDARWYADSDGDGLADAWELSVGLNPDVYDDPSADVDGDGRTLLREFEADGPPLLDDVETLVPSAPLNASAPLGEDRFGQALAGADFNLDGYADTVIGAPLHGGRGKVYVAYGADNNEPSWVQELNPGPGESLYGNSVAAGDWDGNGYPDIAIAFDGGVAIRFNNGRLYDVTDVTLSPPNGATEFGAFLHSGDLDNDGIDDLLVPYLVGGSFSFLQVYRSAGNELLSQTPLRRQVGSEGAIDSISVADIDGDSQPDVLMGLGSSNTVIGYLGAENDWSSEGTSRLRKSFSLYREESQFGFSIASGADIGGDGIDDLVVGAYGGAGSIMVYDSATEYWDDISRDGVARVPPAQIIGGLDDGSAPDDGRGDQFGVSVALGQLDSDSHADVVVGANRTADNDLGQVYIFRGSRKGLRKRPQIEDGLSGSSHLGYYVAIPGDTDGDGYDDVVGGAPKIDAGEAGYVVFMHHQFKAANPADDNDGDGVGKEFDNCRMHANTDQANYDNDAFGDACDADIDGDDIANELDSCPVNDNRDQTDTDGDGEGDVCDTDDDNDGIADEEDAFPHLQGEWEDSDNDGVGDNSDPCLALADGERTPWRDVTTLDNTASGTANGSEIAAIGGCSASGLPTISVFDPADGAFLRAINVSGPELSDWTPLAIDRVADTNGDGMGDDQSLALFGIDHNRNAYFVRLIDPVTGSWLQDDIRFFSARNWVAYDMAVINDADGDGIANDPAVAALGHQLSTGRDTLRVKRLSDGKLIGDWDAFNAKWTPRRLTTSVLDGQPLVAILGDNDLSTSIEYRNLISGERWRMYMFNDLNRGHDLSFVNDADGNGTADDPGIAVIGEKLNRLGQVVSNRLTVRRITDGENTRNSYFSTQKWQVRHIEVIRDANGNGVSDVVGLLEDANELELLSPAGPDYLMRTRDQDTNDRLFDSRLE